jgi:acyl carrier protein
LLYSGLLRYFTRQWGRQSMTATDEITASELIQLTAAALNATPASLSLESGVGDVPGWDSFAHVNLLMKIEDHYKIAFEAEDLLSMETLDDILAAVRRLASNGSALQPGG